MKTCFVCGTIGNDYMNIYGSSTVHSGRQIIDIFEKLFHYELQHFEESKMCLLCFNLFNELDLMETRAKDIGEHLINLYNTHNSLENTKMIKDEIESTAYDNLQFNHNLEEVKTINTVDLDILTAGSDNTITDVTKMKNSRKPRPKTFQCSECPKIWRTSSELKTHIESHRKVNSFVCEICGRAYRHKRALDVHVGMHKGINPFTCAYCGKSFTQKGALVRHLPLHTGDKPFQCDTCGKQFIHHSSFTIHRLSHKGEKSYKCDLCGLTLLTGSHLKRHMRSHTGEKKFSCTICGKRFAERYNVLSHEKLHLKPNLTCSICGKLFKTQATMKDHRLREHEQRTDEETCLSNECIKTESLICGNLLENQAKLKGLLIKENQQRSDEETCLNTKYIKTEICT